MKNVDWKKAVEEKYADDKEVFVKLKERVVVDTENFQSIDEVAASLVDNYTEGPIEGKFRYLGPQRGFVVERITPVKLD